MPPDLRSGPRSPRVRVPNPGHRASPPTPVPAHILAAAREYRTLGMSYVRCAALLRINSQRLRDALKEGT